MAQGLRVESPETEKDGKKGDRRARAISTA